MDWNAIGAIGEVVGGIAVVATLFYLSIQISHNNIRANREEITTSFQQISGSRLAIAQDPDLAELIVRGGKSLDGLTEAEVIRFGAIMGEQFWFFMSIWDRKRVGAIDDEYWTNLVPGVKDLLSSPGISAWWSSARYQFPRAFAEELDGFIIESQG